MSKLLTTFIVVSTSLVVGLFAYLGSFSQLMADDYCSVYFVESLGILRSVWFWYTNWHGGFSASFADSLLGVIGQDRIGYVVPLTLVIWVLSLAWAITLALKFFELQWHGLVPLALSLLIMCGTLVVSPAASASLIWWGGLRGYAPPLIIVPVYVGLYILFRDREHQISTPYIWYAVSFGLLCISGGFSEPFTPLQIIITSLMLAVELYINRNVLKTPKGKFLIAGILGGVVALLIMVIAPGNANRQELYPAPPPLLGILSIGLRSYLLFFARLGHDFLKVVISVTIFSSSMLLGTFFSDSKYFNYRNFLVTVTLGLLFAFCSFLPAAYGQSGEPSDTSLITPVYVLMIMLCVAGIVGGGTLMKTMQGVKPYHAILAVLLVLPLLGYSTITSIQRLSDEMGRAATYAESWHDRDVQIRRARQDGLQQVFVPPIPRWITQEPTDNPKFFVNECMSLYYGIDITSSPDANK